MNVQFISKGLGDLVRFGTKTPMRKYGSVFFTLGFGTGFFTGRSTNASMTEIATGAAIIGTVLANIPEEEKQISENKN